MWYFRIALDANIKQCPECDKCKRPITPCFPATDEGVVSSACQGLRTRLIDNEGAVEMSHDDAKAAVVAWQDTLPNPFEGLG
jgi:hypothetical protein